MTPSEFDIIRTYFSPQNQRNDVLLAGGDDCAIVSADSPLAITTDTLVSGVHFPENTAPQDIASKALAVNLSDLAAMGADPAWLSLALTLPEVNTDWLSAFSTEFNRQLADYGLSLIGGDTTRGPLSITVQAMGLLPAGKAMKRSNAKPGDSLFVTGTLGDAAVGLNCIIDGITDNALSPCVEQLNRPQPRNRFATALRDYCNCAIDISDGLLADLGHILDASDCGAVINRAAIPVSDSVRYYFERYNNNVIDWAMVLSHGDDYELCFTLPENHVASVTALALEYQLQITCIGHITDGRTLVCLDENQQTVSLPVSGYRHFD